MTDDIGDALCGCGHPHRRHGATGCLDCLYSTGSGTERQRCMVFLPMAEGGPLRRGVLTTANGRPLA